MASPSWATLGLLCTPGSHQIIACGLSQLQGGAQGGRSAGFCSVLSSLLISTAGSHGASARFFLPKYQVEGLEGPEAHPPEEEG